MKIVVVVLLLVFLVPSALAQLSEFSISEDPALQIPDNQFGFFGMALAGMIVFALIMSRKRSPQKKYQ